MKKFYSKNTIVIIITLIGILFACKKPKEETQALPPPAAMVTASIAGLVTDTNNVAITSATVAAGISVTTPDANGRFTISNAQLDKDAGVVTISKSGYFTGARTFVPSVGSVNNVKIQLIPKKVAGSFDAGSGGAINILGGGKVDFGSGSVVNASTGASFSGNVSASALFLNPTDSNFKVYMPRDLQGIDANNNKGVLRSYGIAAVELDDASGNKLQLAPGKTATITLPIVPSLLSDAPATVPLWYFDDTKGLWKQEGTATKQGNNYVGTVKHFSFWSAGQLTQAIKLTITFKDSAGHVLPNKRVWISSPSNGAVTGYTDNAGTISGFVPANDALAMQVSDDYCGILIYKMHIGPFSNDTNLGIITVSNYGNPVQIIITGTAVRCTNLPIEKGFAVITSSYNYGQFISAISNGSFTVPINICKDLPIAATVWVYDSVNNQSSQEYPITINSTNQNIGQIQINGCATAPPVAGFTYLVGNTSLPVTVTFTNTSTSATSWLWNFGDGATSADQNPTHSYTTSGDFTVSLTATGPAGSNTVSKAITISGIVDDSYINLTMNGTNHSWAPPDLLSAQHVDSVNHTLIQADEGSSQSIHFFILNDNDSPGNYNITLSATLNGVSYPDNSAATIVTEYGIPGGYIIGTASGQMKAQDSTSYRPFSMSYKVKRY